MKFHIDSGRSYRYKRPEDRQRERLELFEEFGMSEGILSMRAEFMADAGHLQILLTQLESMLATMIVLGENSDKWDELRGLYVQPEGAKIRELNEDGSLGSLPVMVKAPRWVWHESHVLHRDLTLPKICERFLNTSKWCECEGFPHPVVPGVDQSVEDTLEFLCVLRNVLAHSRIIIHESGICGMAHIPYCKKLERVNKVFGKWDIAPVQSEGEEFVFWQPHLAWLWRIFAVLPKTLFIPLLQSEKLPVFFIL